MKHHIISFHCFKICSLINFTTRFIFIIKNHLRPTCTVDHTHETVDNVQLQQYFNTKSKNEFGDDLETTSKRPTIELNVYPKK